MIAPVLSEDRISFSEAARIAGVHSATVWRWFLAGVGGVRLEGAKIGGMRYTTRQALERFVAAINGAAAPDAGDSTPAAGERERQISAAEAELIANGA